MWHTDTFELARTRRHGVGCTPGDGAISLEMVMMQSTSDSRRFLLLVGMGRPYQCGVPPPISKARGQHEIACAMRGRMTGRGGDRSLSDAAYPALKDGACATQILVRGHPFLTRESA